MTMENDQYPVQPQEHPLTPPEPLGVTQPVAPSSDKLKARNRFLVWLFIWLAVLPGAVIIQLLWRAIAGVDGPTTLVNLLTLLMSVYGFLGWIPALILGIIWGNKK